ncbi:MAG: low temperature requirement protein [Thermoleophilia bacterium]|nr:low temperature requirement protein [Thermoleophilia bacterium]
MTTDVAVERDGTIQSASSFELFFDLVFVFGFTQVTALLAADPTWQGLAHGMLVLAALWWAWGGYAWLATTTSLEEGGTRIATIGVMCAMLVVGVATPGAFGEHAVAFAIAYAVVRYLHIVVYIASCWGDSQLMRNVLGLLPGTTVSAVAILLAAFQDGAAAIALWAVALLLDYIGPLFLDPEGWTVGASHFAERHGLIFIIALGESLIALGIGAGELPIDVRFVVLCSFGTITIAAIWWTYFDVVAIVAERRLEKAHGGERAALARDSYSYLHLPMVAGVILYALGVKKAFAHPEEALKVVPATALVGGIALYLAAHVLFRLRNIRTLNRPRLVVAVVLVALIPTIGTRLDSGWLVTVVAVAMMVLVAYERIRYAEARARIRAREWRADDHAHPPTGSDVAR